MFRHLAIAALRNIAANRLQSALAIVGLSIGITAAILAGLVIANQTNYDRFFPGYDRLYVMTVEASLGGRPTFHIADTPHDLAPRLRQNFGEIEAVARFKSASHSLRSRNTEAQETIYAADPNIFQLLPLPALYGDLGSALAEPDTIVIPLQVARKYFGRDNVVGQTLQLDRQHPLKITAVIADLPENATSLETGIFLSGRFAWSDLSMADQKPANSRDGNFALDVRTLVRLAPTAALEPLQNRIATSSDSLLPRPAVVSARARLVRLDALHLSANFSPGARQRLTVFSMVALLILFLASVNFINLSTARAARRGLEVGIRKAAGAGQGVLMAQFLAEAVLQALLALMIAAALAERLLPQVNAFLNSGGVFEYWRSPALIAALILGAAIVGLLAGTYPAFVLSAFRPATVLKGLSNASSKAPIIRGILVTAQFAILVVLLIAAQIVLDQHRFAMNDGVRLDSGNTLFVRLSETVNAQGNRSAQCDGPFAHAVAGLAGVRAVTCSDSGLIRQINMWTIRRTGGDSVAVSMVGTGPGLLEMYGQHVIVGRGLTAADKLADSAKELKMRTAPMNLVINESAVRKLGFASAEAAIGQSMRLEGAPLPVVIVGVVRDFSVLAPERKIEATAYDYFMQDYLLHIKLDGKNMPATLARIDAAWNRAGASGPIDRTFMDDYVGNLHLALLREGQVFSIFAGIAMLLGCLGLFGLATFTAKQRTKEIGVRKAMGASSGDVTRPLRRHPRRAGGRSHGGLRAGRSGIAPSRADGRTLEA